MHVAEWYLMLLFFVFPYIGSMCPKLHGKILENEPKDIPTIPRISNSGQ